MSREIHQKLEMLQRSLQELAESENKALERVRQGFIDERNTLTQARAKLLRQMRRSNLKGLIEVSLPECLEKFHDGYESRLHHYATASNAWDFRSKAHEVDLPVVGKRKVCLEFSSSPYYGDKGHALRVSCALVPENRISAVLPDRPDYLYCRLWNTEIIGLDYQQAAKIAKEWLKQVEEGKLPSLQKAKVGPKGL